MENYTPDKDEITQVIDIDQLNIETLRQRSAEARQEISRAIALLTPEKLFFDLRRVLLEQLYFAAVNGARYKKIIWRDLLGQVETQHGIRLVTTEMCKDYPDGESYLQRVIPPDEWENICQSLENILRARKLRPQIFVEGMMVRW